MLLILFDLCMAIIMFFFGLYFYKSKGKASNLLTGFNMRPDEEQQRYDKVKMCTTYGVRLMIMAIPFLLGACIDIFFPGKGCLIAWIVWTVLFISLMAKRMKMEK